MKLYGSYTSPFVRHCRIALAECALPFEFVTTDYEQSARLSPTRKVPMLADGDLKLTDSTSILRHIRERGGQPFFPSLVDFDRYLMANTALDSAVNLFLLEKDGVTPATSPYLKRQSERVAGTLSALDATLPDDAQPPYSDGQLRLGCFLSWALFRERLTLDGYPRLAALLAALDRYPPFAATHPSLSG